MTGLESQRFQCCYGIFAEHRQTEEDVSYHVVLAQDAGLIRAINLSTHAGQYWRPTRLTFEGHEFLDAARNESRWRKAQAIVLQRTGTITIEALKIALAELVQKAMASGL